MRHPKDRDPLARLEAEEARWRKDELSRAIAKSPLRRKEFHTDSGIPVPDLLTPADAGRPSEEEIEKYERDLNVTIEARSQYRFGKDVNVDVLLTNSSSEPLWTDIWNQYLQEEPELTKNGKTVKYRTDEDVTFEGKLRVVDFRERSTSIDTHATKKVRTVNLLDWYKTLEPGSYELTVGHRFWLKGKALKSNSVTIEIIP